MEFQIRKLSAVCCIFRRSRCLFISRWSNIVRIICTSRMSLTWINIYHHCIIMLPISSNGTSCSLSNLVCIILIAIAISVSSFSVIMCLIDRFISPISGIIHGTLRNFIWIWLFNRCIWHIITRMDNCLI